MSRVHAPSPGQAQGPVLASRQSIGDDGGAGLTGWWAPRWAECWLRTRGARRAKALGAWWAVGPAEVPAGVAAAASGAEQEAELLSWGVGPRWQGGSWCGAAGLGGAGDMICLKNFIGRGWPDGFIPAKERSPKMGLLH